MDRPLALQVIETVAALGRGSNPSPNARSHWPMTQASALLPVLLRPEASADWTGDDYVIAWSGGEIKLANVRRFLAPKVAPVALPKFILAAAPSRLAGVPEAARSALAEADGTVVVTDGHRLHVGKLPDAPGEARMLPLPTTPEWNRNAPAADYPNWREWAMLSDPNAPELAVRELTRRIRLAQAALRALDESDRAVPVAPLFPEVPGLNGDSVNVRYVLDALTALKPTEGVKISTGKLGAGTLPALRFDRPDGSFAVICLMVHHDDPEPAPQPDPQPDPEPTPAPEPAASEINNSAALSPRDKEETMETTDEPEPVDNPIAFNPHEQDILTVLAAADDPMSIADLAAACFPGEKAIGDLEAKSHSKQAHGRGVSGYRKVINALRRPVKYGYIDKSGRGTYVATKRGKAAA